MQSTNEIVAIHKAIKDLRAVSNARARMPRHR
jgi:hypothetical protein